MVGVFHQCVIVWHVLVVTGVLVVQEVQNKRNREGLLMEHLTGSSNVGITPLGLCWCEGCTGCKGCAGAK